MSEQAAVDLMVPQNPPAREDGANLIAVPVTSPVDPSTCIAKKVDQTVIEDNQ